MRIRAAINERAKLTAIATGVMVTLVIRFIVWPRFGNDSHVNSLSFYSDDDGASYFIAEAKRLPPFEHREKAAVIAAVYRCGESGKPFVAYLMKYGEDQSQDTAPAAVQLSTPVFIKKPHDVKWTQATGKTARECDVIVTPICPHGESGTMRLVSPSDPDNGAQPE